jgi:hypothetical protein
MMTKNEALKMAIDTLQNAKRRHFYCEDTYYSCPKHEDGCADDRQPYKCNCGADELNAEIDISINACKEALEQPVLTDEKGRPMTYWGGREQPAQDYVFICKRCGDDLGFEYVPNEQPAQEVECSNHPDAPHGFCRDASHSAGRYVCECEGWEVEQPAEPRLVSYAPDGSTCTLNIDGEEVYFNREQPAQCNFCERCGKRASKDPYHIHTCTPPQALKEKNT